MHGTDTPRISPYRPDNAYRAGAAAVVAAVAVPTMIVTQFAFLAAVPAASVVYSVVRHSRDPRWRGIAAAYAAVYAAPWLVWATREHPAKSLSKDMSPVSVVIVTLATFAMAVALWSTRRARPARRQLPAH